MSSETLHVHVMGADSIENSIVRGAKHATAKYVHICHNRRREVQSCDVIVCCHKLYDFIHVMRRQRWSPSSMLASRQHLIVLGAKILRGRRRGIRREVKARRA